MAIARRPAGPVVLIAEDDVDDRDLIMMAVTQARLEMDIRYVRNGIELLASLGLGEHREEALAPELIVLDLQMPGVGGVEAISAIRGSSQWQATPVAVLTTSAADRDIRACQDAGADVYICKPSCFSDWVRVARFLQSLIPGSGRACRPPLGRALLKFDRRSE